MVFTPFWCKSYTILVLWVGDGLIVAAQNFFLLGLLSHIYCWTFIWVDVGLIFAMELDLLVFKIASRFAKSLFWSFKVVRPFHLITVLGIQSICPHQRIAHFILFTCNHAKEL